MQKIDASPQNKNNARVFLTFPLFSLVSYSDLNIAQRES